MSRLLVPAAALCLVTVAACGGSPEPPSWFAQRTELPSCGIDEPGRDDHPDLAARECFREAFEADRPAELTRVTYGDEGESIRAHFRVLGGGRYEIVGRHVDSPREGSGTSGWFRDACERVVFSENSGTDAGGTPELDAVGECEQVEYVGA